MYNCTAVVRGPRTRFLAAESPNTKDNGGGASVLAMICVAATGGDNYPVFGELSSLETKNAEFAVGEITT